ncbi:coiled-coil domain-containing protein [Gimesia panareensis]|uniref:Uncharacterized protein n=1 Tax=Gimesia panareensis TaxID=2527978 RepID=A0A517QFW8_9PLAN|nr:hypothetical protein [Gimesia panareensis]QDT30514.1 hypothetical protein Enr10x_58800 [Gimesia panareensis]QDU53571.1 hypothetical protein Pan110_59630 [Gimesia panareensis]
MLFFGKKILIGAAVLATLGTFVFGRDVISYMKTAGTSVRDAVKSEVPVDFEVERARKMVEDLVPDIRRCMHVIAEQQVDVETLQQEMHESELAMKQQKEAMFTLRSDLESNDTEFVYASRTYSKDDIRSDLAQRFDRFKVASETLKRNQQILKAREKALDANREKLENMLSSKMDLEVQIEQLEARLKSVQAAETVSNLQIDNSQLTRAKSLIRDLNKQLDVKEKLLDAEGKFTGLIPVDTKAEEKRDVVKQMDEYFKLKSGDKVAAQ